MKVAAGCFGCLAFVFLALTLGWGMIWSFLMSASPQLARQVGPASAYIQYVNGTCCCLSTTAMIGLLVAGSMKKKGELTE